jgi:hypothetical protein
MDLGTLGGDNSYAYDINDVSTYSVDPYLDRADSQEHAVRKS